MSDGNVDQVQTRFDAEHEKGYRGARVDPNPNSAYSYESDPTTSPGAGDRLPAERLVEIDQFADPRNPRIDEMYGPDGLDDLSEGGTPGIVEDDVVGPQRAPAAGAAVNQTTPFLDSPDRDGVVSAATITAVATVAADSSNYRTFTLHNVTKGVDVASKSTATQALATGTPVALTLSGTAANLNVSEGDEFTIVETHSGTGVAHTGVDVKFTVHRADTEYDTQ